MRKRTEEEVDLSIKRKDYTGGYKFFPWLLFMRSGFLIGFFGNMLIGTYLIFNAEGENIAYYIGSFFGLITPIIIAYMLVRDYKKLKKGISS